MKSKAKFASYSLVLGSLLMIVLSIPAWADRPASSRISRPAPTQEAKKIRKPTEQEVSTSKGAVPKQRKFLGIFPIGQKKESVSHGAPSSGAGAEGETYFESMGSIPATPNVPAFDALLSKYENHPCVKHNFSGRGKMYEGYWKGMIHTFVKSYCRPQAHHSSLYDDPKTAMVTATHNKYDVLAYYQRSGLITPEAPIMETNPKHLISMFTILTSLGMRETTGHFNEGYDANAGRGRKPASIEGGLFQTSFSSVGNDKMQLRYANLAMRKLVKEYTANPERCLTSVFEKGIPARRQPASIGKKGTEAYEFQQLSRNCPAFAVEWALIVSRKAYNHWGPLKRRSAVPVKACQSMYRDIYATLEESKCGSYSRAWGG